MRGSSAARFPHPRDQAGFLRCAPQVHRVVRHPVRRYDGSATAPPSVKGFGSHLLSTDARSCCLLGAPCRIRTLLTIRWISGKARTGEFLITLYRSDYLLSVSGGASPAGDTSATSVPALCSRSESNPTGHTVLASDWAFVR